jgi:predicted nucleic acid-binding protein
MIEPQFVLDTNVIIDLTENKIAPLPRGGRFVSIISEMEMLAFPSLTPESVSAR